MTVRTKADKAAVARLRRYLDTSHHTFSGSAVIVEAFTDPNVRRYLETWVLPLLDELDPQPPQENNDKRAADIIMGRTPAPLAALRHHVTGAIERGEATAVTEQRAELPAPVRAFLGMLARMQTDTELDDSGNGGMSGDDACAALSGAIEQARALLGVQA